MSKGFSVIELLIAIAILSVLSVFVTGTYTKFNALQALDKDSSLVYSVLSQARTLTLSSKGNSRYGVHFDSNKIVLFTGSSYSTATTSNVEFPLASTISATTNLSGGGSNVIFDRLTGKTSHNGTITLRSTAMASSSRVITVYGTGVVQSN